MSFSDRMNKLSSIDDFELHALLNPTANNGAQTNVQSTSPTTSPISSPIKFKSCSTSTSAKTQDIPQKTEDPKRRLSTGKRPIRDFNKPSKGNDDEIIVLDSSSDEDDDLIVCSTSTSASKAATSAKCSPPKKERLSDLLECDTVDDEDSLEFYKNRPAKFFIEYAGVKELFSCKRSDSLVTLFPEISQRFDLPVEWIHLVYKTKTITSREESLNSLNFNLGTGFELIYSKIEKNQFFQDEQIKANPTAFPDEFSLKILDSHKKKLTVSVRPSTTIEELKEMIGVIQGIAHSKIQLLDEGVCLDNDQTIEDYDLEDGFQLDMKIEN